MVAGRGGGLPSLLTGSPAHVHVRWTSINFCFCLRKFFSEIFSEIFEYFSEICISHRQH